MESLLFGYGSLISPIDLLSKIQNPDELSDAYKTAGEPYVLECELDEWKKSDQTLRQIPVKLYGFQRYYSKPSVRGGAVLEAVHTGNQDDWINGVLIDGLTRNQYDRIASTEPGYNKLEIKHPCIKFYNGKDQQAYNDVAIEIFVRTVSPSDLTIDVQRNEIYHQRIKFGIRLLEEVYDTEILSKFLHDFQESTYELKNGFEEQNQFVTIKDNNQ